MPVGCMESEGVGGESVKGQGVKGQGVKGEGMEEDGCMVWRGESGWVDGAEWIRINVWG